MFLIVPICSVIVIKKRFETEIPDEKKNEEVNGCAK